MSIGIGVCIADSGDRVERGLCACKDGLLCVCVCACGCVLGVKQKYRPSKQTN